MKVINYLKDAPQGKKGEVATVTDVEASALVAMGFAELYVPPKQKQKPTTKSE